MPPLDRDEARFVQASSQMLESGDFITIHFQQTERNKKPVGIHWLQAASVSMVSTVEARQIWAYRLPSVLAAILACLLTYQLGTRLFGSQCGLMAGLLMASAPVVIGESAIAKTDAALLACVCAAQYCLWRVIERPHQPPYAKLLWPLGFWGALTMGTYIKGPIAPMISLLTVVSFCVASRSWRLLKDIRPISGAALLLLLLAPWAVLIGIATEGRFFSEAIGIDMLGKVGAAQEHHHGPPGYHLALLGLLFWPAAALLLPALKLGWQKCANARFLFLLCWIVPSWIVFELSATKLPHYTMPLFAPLAILAGILASQAAPAPYTKLRKISAVLYGAISLAPPIALVMLPLHYGTNMALWPFITLAALLFGLSLYAGWHFWHARAQRGVLYACAASLLFGLLATSYALPRLPALHLSTRINDALIEAQRHPIKNDHPPAVLADYYEPSAVFLLGTQTTMSDGSGAASYLSEYKTATAIITQDHETAFQQHAAKLRMHVTPIESVSGLNYSNGKKLTLTLYRRSD